MQFNLNKDNEDIYMSTLRIYNIQVEAEFFRKILYDYIDMPKFKRELIVFQKTVKELEKAMSKKKKIEKLIQQYNKPTTNNKDEILAKMMKQNSYISFLSLLILSALLHTSTTGFFDFFNIIAIS